MHLKYNELLCMNAEAGEGMCGMLQVLQVLSSMYNMLHAACALSVVQCVACCKYCIYLFLFTMYIVVRVIFNISFFHMLSAVIAINPLSARFSKIHIA